MTKVKIRPVTMAAIATVTGRRTVTETASAAAIASTTSRTTTTTAAAGVGT